MKEITFPGTGIYLKRFIDDRYSDENVYDFDDFLTEEEFNQFKEFMVQHVLSPQEYFPCEVNGETKEVRFGLVSQSKTPEGIIVRGPLVTKVYDEENKPYRSQDNFNQNTTNDFVKTKIINDSLINILLEKNILTDEEVAKIKEVTREELFSALFEYRTFNI